MAERIEEKSRFKIAVEAPKEAGGALVFTFTPKKFHPERTAKGVKRRPPQYSVVVTGSGEMMSFDWSDSPDVPGPFHADLESEISERLRERDVWFDRVAALVNDADRWAAELGWSTRRVEKKLDDAYVGRRRIAALQLQKDTLRIMVEPMGRSAKESEGVVDLYVMPAYDDLASLYYYDDRWNFHYMFREDPLVGNLRETKNLTFSKESLGRVLSEMTRNAEAV